MSQFNNWAGTIHKQADDNTSSLPGFIQPAWKGFTHLFEGSEALRPIHHWLTQNKYAPYAAGALAGALGGVGIGSLAAGRQGAGIGGLAGAGIVPAALLAYAKWQESQQPGYSTPAGKVDVPQPTATVPQAPSPTGGVTAPNTQTVPAPVAPPAPKFNPPAQQPQATNPQSATTQMVNSPMGKLQQL